MKTFATILTICFCFVNCSAQDNKEVLSHIPKTGKSVRSFIPKGYDTLATASGDLNKDGQDDIVMVLRDVQEDTAQPGSDAGNNDRLIVVLFKTADGWALAAKSGEIVLCKECGGVFGDPFAGIKVGNGVITIDHFGGSADKWGFSRKFRYQDSNFFLIGKSDFSYQSQFVCDKLNAPQGESTDVNLLTGDREVKKITKDCKKISKKDKINKLPLTKMADYKNDF